MGVDVNVNAVSVLLAYADDDSNTGVEITGSSLRTDGTLAVGTRKENYVNTSTVHVEGTMLAGGVLWADATTGSATYQFVDDGHGDNKNFTYHVDADKGQSKVQVNGNSSLTGKMVALNAVNASAAKAQIVNVDGSVEENLAMRVQPRKLPAALRSSRLATPGLRRTRCRRALQWRPKPGTEKPRPLPKRM